MLPTSTPSSPFSMLSGSDGAHVPPAFVGTYEKACDLARLTEIFSNLTAEICLLLAITKQIRFCYELPELPDGQTNPRSIYGPWL